MCGVNRIKSLADDLRLFDLFCPVRPLNLPLYGVRGAESNNNSALLSGFCALQFRSSNFSDETPEERAQSFLGWESILSFARGFAVSSANSPFLVCCDASAALLCFSLARAWFVPWRLKRQRQRF